MAYNQGGYGQSNPYSQQSNPYAQEAGNPYGQQGLTQGGYGGRPQETAYGGRTQQTGYESRYSEDHPQGPYGSDVEMAPLNGQANGYGQQGRDPNAVLNECRDIDRGIDAIERNLEQLRRLQQRSLDDADASPNTRTNHELDALSSETMTLYRNFAARIKAIKSQPESGSPKNAPQVGRVDRKLKNAINQYQQVESDFRRKLQVQMERQYRIVRPDASEAEVREACEDTTQQQVFSQALLQSDRRGQSQSALRAVEGRHQAIQKIEQQMIQLAELFQDMEALVVQQEPAVQNIEQKGEEVTDNVGKANVEIAGAITSARARNRKKWWCLLICVIILIIIAVVVAVAVVVTNNNKNKV
ncbi:MAG: Plasma membrane t-SNARE, secretory vesicle fusion [Pycnora praestabilis]|nr:MAG: Plasma membrane t-SNARE, secretory vesicle fusion [Pycnora praestabilis]